LGKDYDMEQEEKFTYWKDEEIWLGYLERFPDYWTQGESFEQLEDNLKDLFFELTGNHLPAPRQSGTLKIA
jgi:predicted RNase H-like HicB family nuclease